MISCPFSSVSTGHAPIQGKGRFVKWRHWHKSTLFVNEIIRGDFMRMPLCERRSADPGRIRCCRIGGTFRGTVFVRESFYPVPFARVVLYCLPPDPCDASTDGLVADGPEMRRSSFLIASSGTVVIS